MSIPCFWTKREPLLLGNRQAVEFIPLPGIKESDLADAAQLSSLSDETPEGRSIVVLAKTKYGLRGREVGSNTRLTSFPFLPRPACRASISMVARFARGLTTRLLSL